MLKEMTRAFSIAAGALVALVGIALVLLGAAWLLPHLLRIHGATGRTVVIVSLVGCLSASQYRRWRAAKRRRQNPSENRRREVSPLDLTSGM
ncbi:MAG: hypothetical protein ABSH47_01565 [Bryobacteraceae bacterium]|jgi:hypothetical protein